MALLNFNYGLVKDLPQNVINGNLYVTTDTQGLYVDLDDTRIHVSDFIQVESVEALNALGTYHTQVFYYVTGSNALMKYTGDAETPWKQLNSTADLSGELDALKKRISKNETDIATNASAINSLTGTVTSLSSTKADKTAVEELSGKVVAAEKAISDHATEYNILKGRVDGHDTSIEKAQGDASKALEDAAAAGTAASNAQSKAEEAFAKANEVLGTAEDGAEANTVFGAKAAAAVAQEAAETAQDEVDALEQTVANLKTSLETADAGLSDRIEDLEAVIDGVQGAMHFIGVSITDPTSGVITIEGKDEYAPENGDVVVYKDAEDNTIEYIYANGVWVELGDVSAEAKRIGTLEASMATVQTAVEKIPNIEKSIEEINTAKSALEARVKANEDAIKAHSTQISGLDTRLTQAESDITTTAAAIRNELKAKAEALESAITAEETARTNAVTNLQNQIDVINGQLTWTKLTSV